MKTSIGKAITFMDVNEIIFFSDHETVRCRESKEILFKFCVVSVTEYIIGNYAQFSYMLIFSNP
jgi:hypothetical protein